MTRRDVAPPAGQRSFIDLLRESKERKQGPLAESLRRALAACRLAARPVRRRKGAVR